MKLATQSYTTSIVLAGGLTLVFLSPLLIRAEADGVANSQTSNAVIVLESPPRVITNADASKLLEQPRAELQGQPNHEELNRSPDEYQPNQDLPVPSPDRSLLAVTRSTSAKGLTAMRFIEKARNLLKAGEQKKALSTLEKALGLEANPYVYFLSVASSLSARPLPSGAKF